MSSFLAGRQRWNFGGFDSLQAVEAMYLLEGANTTTNHNDTADCPCDLNMAMDSSKFLDDIPIYVNALGTGSAWMTPSSQHPPTLDEHHPGTLVVCGGSFYLPKKGFMSGDQSKPCVMWSEFACSQHGAADWMLQRHWEESLVHGKWIYQAVI